MAWLWHRRTLVVALLAAVALNLFLGSVIAGHWMQASPTGWNAGSMIERRAARLPEADAVLLRAAWAERGAEVEGRYEDLRAARERARASAAAEPFETAALAAALAEVRARTHALQQAFHQLYLEIAPRLSAEGRRGLFERRRRADG